MLKRLRGIWASTLYVQIWKDRLRVFDPSSNERFDETSLVAIRDGMILAAGNEAKRYDGNRDVDLVNPFDHPRMLIGNWIVAERLLQHAVRLLFKESLIRPAPKMILHPMESLEGGLSDVEKRALRELAISAGGRDVAIHVGPELARRDIQFESVQKAEDD
ncbi:MAG: rod shape-determining protein MreB [Gammaproteobacteria bacterium]|jgi:rod shape-determining protein MreB and related proteins|nr:rod shape-determining protein MreB [Gammaproteobacteria bacterium]MBT4494220.1 rod shape-determining protein MreB [Gammaproteobacteria bacterium]